MTTAGDRPCACGSGVPYASCCGPLHDNRVQARTAEQLMRSRYAAYALGRLDHVFRTWHPRTRPVEVEPNPGLTWTGLTIDDVQDGQQGQDSGVVVFTAAYRTPTGPGLLHEHSRFARRAGRWYYVDGDVEESAS
jgi:SEC-C motif-containing protein